MILCTVLAWHHEQKGPRPPIHLSEEQDPPRVLRTPTLCGLPWLGWMPFIQAGWEFYQLNGKSDLCFDCLTSLVES